MSKPLDCDVRFACNGGCPNDRFATSPYGESGPHYLCPSYEAYTLIDRCARWRAS
jgi:uncharacterized protein